MVPTTMDPTPSLSFKGLQLSASARKRIHRLPPRISRLVQRVLKTSLQSLATAAICFVIVRIAIEILDDVKVINGLTFAFSRTRRSGAEYDILGTRRDWGRAEEIPEFCKRIEQNPSPFRRDCNRDSKNMSCTTFPKETPMFSQFKQDYYLFTRHFAELKRPGVYLDVAANDPVSISNTYFFDRCLRWSGVCVEANPSYFEKIHRLRSCHMVPTCVGRREGEMVEFALSGGSGGILGSSNKHMEKWMKADVHIPTIKARCTTIQKVLDRGNIRVVDFMSLDVEGHELNVLMGIDWTRTRINVMSIEVSGTTVQDIEKWMDKIGYKRLIPQLDSSSMKSGRLGEDVIFLHPDVVFGSPQ